MDDLESMPPPCFNGEPELAAKGHAVFLEKRPEGTSFLGAPMPINLDTFEFLLREGVSAHFRADDFPPRADDTQSPSPPPNPADPAAKADSQQLSEHTACSPGLFPDSGRSK